jgi:hypothetical protein
MDAVDVCRKAGELVSGPRAASHGDKYINHSCIARLWNAYLRNAGLIEDRGELDPTDVALMMALLKVARTQSGGAHNEDNYVDLAGYAGVSAETAAVDRSNV